MKSLILVLPLCMPGLSFAASKGALPIQQGYYVVQGTSCQDPASVNIFGNYEDHVAFGHDGCTIVSGARKQSNIDAKLDCSNLQSDQKSGVSLNIRFTIINKKTVVIGSRLSKDVEYTYQVYNYCAPQLN